jgi:hypothetical protein
MVATAVAAARRGEGAVHHRTPKHLELDKLSRSPKPALNPYYLEDVAMTLSDVLRARGLDRPVAARH